MMISYIQSNYQGLGSGVVVDGISMQNRGNNFVLRPDHPNVVAPRKRPFHTIIPAFITKNGQPVMSFGVMGGSMQAQGHTQIMTRFVDYHQNPQAAADAPRWRIDDGLTVKMEEGVPADVVEELQRRGPQSAGAHRPTPHLRGAQPMYFLGEGQPRAVQQPHAWPAARVLMAAC